MEGRLQRTAAAAVLVESIGSGRKQKSPPDWQSLAGCTMVESQGLHHPNNATEVRRLGCIGGSGGDSPHGCSSRIPGLVEDRGGAIMAGRPSAKWRFVKSPRV